MFPIIFFLIIGLIAGVTAFFAYRPKHFSLSSLKKIGKKLLYYLQHADGIWSVPLAITLFWIIGTVLTGIFGYTTGTYDIGFIQPLFLASAVVIGATNVAVAGMYFTFRGLYRYIWGGKVRDRQTGELKERIYARVNWLKLTEWQRFLVAFGVFFYFVTAIIIVYLQFV